MWVLDLERVELVAKQEVTNRWCLLKFGHLWHRTVAVSFLSDSLCNTFISSVSDKTFSTTQLSVEADSQTHISSCAT